MPLFPARLYSYSDPPFYPCNLPRTEINLLALPQAFADRVTHTIGIDISDGMVAEYNRRAEAAGIPPEKRHAVAGDLLSNSSTFEGPEFHDFDFAIIAHALHHMEDPSLTLQRLVQRLKPGGVVLVLDWEGEFSHEHGHLPDKHDGHKHGVHGHGAHSHADAGVKDIMSDDTVAHKGFNEERMAKFMRDAGCDEVGYVLTDEPFRGEEQLAGMVKTAFLARGRKAL